MGVIDFRNLPENRVATTDEHGSRMMPIPARVKGIWQRRRTVVQGILIAVLLGLPWLRVGGVPAILLDIPGRRFTFFGLTLFAHDGPKIFFALFAVVLALALTTAVFGRAWCGWACPQTVFIDGVFRRLERWIIGNRAEQLRMRNGQLTPRKLFKKIVLWSAFLLVSLLLSHTLVAYFVSTDRLIEWMQRPPAENLLVFSIMAGITGVILFNFGWFREQFCLIMCPYGRFQSILMDKNTVTVAYDVNRGEPRDPQLKKKTEDQGDCIDCFKCVSVCPTGIDIRKGYQMECIACTACMDACDEVMMRAKRPKGLIRYASVNSLEGLKQKWLRPRVGVYASLLALCLFGLTLSLSNRSSFQAEILRGQNPYQKIMLDGHPRTTNQFRLHIRNQTDHEIHVKLSLAEDDLADGYQMIAPQNPVLLAPQSDQHVPFFIVLPETSWGERKVHIQLADAQAPEIEMKKRVSVLTPNGS